MKKIIRKLMSVERTTLGGQDTIEWFEESDDEKQIENQVAEKDKQQ